MKNRDLVIFSQSYIEIFLLNEIVSLSNQFNHVYFFTTNKPRIKPMNIPKNVSLVEMDLNNPVYLRMLLKRYYYIFLIWFVGELFKSKKRIEYLINFKWHFNRLAGIINNAIILNKKIDEIELKDPVFYTFWFDDWGSILSILTKIRPKFNFVSSVHLFDFEEEFSAKKYIPFRNTEITKPKLILPISKYAVNYIKSRYNVNSSLMRLGVFDKGINPIGTSNYYTIVTCSSISWYKRPLLLAQLISEIKLQIRWYHFGDGELKKEFLGITDELPNNISFNYMGRIENDELISFYKINPVDLFLNVSEYEGIPVTLMEAISFGIPIIGCNVCGVPEIVNENTGLLLEKNFNIIESAIKLEEFLQSKSRVIEFRNKVKEFWKINYNAEINSKKVAEKLYQFNKIKNDTSN